MKAVETKSERIATRVTPKQKALISRAAALRGRSLTEFIIDSAQREAEKAIEKELIIHLAVEHQFNLVKVLENPPRPNKALKKAAQDYDQSSIISE